jgi:hypothetical protein
MSLLPGTGLFGVGNTNGALQSNSSI